MFSVHLHNLLFHAHHGLYEEEKLLGNEYEVNAEVQFEQDERITSIHHTVNYISVYYLIKDRMNIPTPLLETLAYDMAEEIYQLDARIKKIFISIKKKYPPVISMEGAVGVSYSREY
ncbi:MAG: dihydroneopterin aldolase [Ferruginibacter sp.]